MKVFLDDYTFEFIDYPKHERAALTQHVSDTTTVMDTFERVHAGKMEGMRHLIFVHEDPNTLFDAFRNYFTELPAAGGVVRNAGKFLLMRRRGEWDLPKGKIEAGETHSEAAIREVEEECGVKVSILRYLTTSWHIYTQKKQRILKPTTWYEMECLDAGKMQPQHSEGITELRWVDHAEAESLLATSFASLQAVFAEVPPPGNPQLF